MGGRRRRAHQGLNRDDRALLFFDGILRVADGDRGSDDCEQQNGRGDVHRKRRAKAERKIALVFADRISFIGDLIAQDFEAPCPVRYRISFLRVPCLPAIFSLCFLRQIPGSTHEPPLGRLRRAGRAPDRRLKVPRPQRLFPGGNLIGNDDRSLADHIERVAQKRLTARSIAFVRA